MILRICWITMVYIGYAAGGLHTLNYVPQASRVVGGGMLFGVECAVACGWIYSQACFDQG